MLKLIVFQKIWLLTSLNIYKEEHNIVDNN